MTVILNWLFFLVFIVFAYVGISYVGQLTSGDSPSLTHTIMRVFKPSIFIPMVLANSMFAASLYFGFLVTPTALTIAISGGVIVSFLYSIIVIGATISVLKLVGVGLILSGIYLIR